MNIMQLRGFLQILLIVFSNLWAGAAELTKEPSQVQAEQISKWRAAAEKGEVWAAFNLALAYQKGEGADQDEREAVLWYRNAADNGYAAAQANLGYCYETGFGVAIDYAEAVRWYQRAAAQGHPYAQYNLGRKYQFGPGVATDPKLAEKWLLKAAERDFVPAYYSLGQLYSHAVSDQQDQKKAFEWFRLAANQGYAAAQHAIGYFYFSGQAGQTNYTEAVKWFNMAASRNFADSHFNLAYCYERGLGVPQNRVAAIAHFRKAAERGHPSAQYSLGVAYYDGKGIESDFVEAYKWWNLAAVGGIVEASSSREILAGLMTPQQIADAQRLASEFKPKQSENVDSPRLIVSAALDSSSIKRTGAGFFVSTNGYLLTSFRTVSDATSIQIMTESGQFEATVAKSDPINDMVLLKISGTTSFLPLIMTKSAASDSPVLILGFEEANQGQFSPKSASGKITAQQGFRADPRQLSIRPHLPSAFAGTAATTPSGQVVGMILLDPEEPEAIAADTNAPPVQLTRAFAVKSDHLISFLNSIKEVSPVISKAALPELSPAELMSRVRAATALILVL